MTAKKGPSRRLRRVLRYYYLRLVRIDDSPEKIAGGVALGVFLGVFPTFGIGLLLAVALASWLHVNRAAALLGSLIMNPITTPFFWGLSWTVGAGIFQVDKTALMSEASAFEAHWASVIGRAGLVYLLGNTLVSAFFAGVGYTITKRLAATVHDRRRARRHRQALRQADGSTRSRRGRARLRPPASPTPGD